MQGNGAAGWKPISEIEVRVHVDGGSVPTPTVSRPAWSSPEATLITIGGDRGSADVEVSWEPTELWYRPLYF